MNKRDLEATYRDYITCLNNQDWLRLGQFVHNDAHHNGNYLGVNGYRAMLEADYVQIPDLHFNIELLAVDPPHIACRLRFDVTPKGSFLGLAVDGKKVTFCENAFYLFSDDKIREVWSVIDKTAIEAQLG